jgi:GTP cyclohydrolase I
VVIKATHLCMAVRGVKHDGDMVTSALRGAIRHEPETRAEFLRLIQTRE